MTSYSKRVFVKNKSAELTTSSHYICNKNTGISLFFDDSFISAEKWDSLKKELAQERLVGSLINKLEKLSSFSQSRFIPQSMLNATAYLCVELGLKNTTNFIESIHQKMRGFDKQDKTPTNFGVYFREQLLTKAASVIIEKIKDHPYVTSLKSPRTDLYLNKYKTIKQCAYRIAHKTCDPKDFSQNLLTLSACLIYMDLQTWSTSEDVRFARNSMLLQLRLIDELITTDVDVIDKYVKTNDIKTQLMFDAYNKIGVKYLHSLYALAKPHSMDIPKEAAIRNLSCLIDAPQV